MRIVRTIAELQKALAPFRGKNKTVGFVPTMGALHEGHISLIDLAKIENHVAVCSIFVNPTQFNDPKDLERYPRPLEEDEKLLKKANCDILFIPSVQEMYPRGDYSTLQEDFGMLDKVMEGKSRPGHFAGMITIVSKLLNAVKPNVAYFGSKDFQQLTLVKYFVKKHNIPVTIRGCDIIREEDGLAMSSRNRLLSPEERKYAVLIPETMKQVKEMWETKSVAELVQFVQDTFSQDGHLRLDYFEIVNLNTLQPLTSKNEPTIACIAAYDGQIRLIDNIVLS